MDETPLDQARREGRDIADAEQVLADFFGGDRYSRWLARRIVDELDTSGLKVVRR